ncbi:MAG TPA: hypothetical protein DCQ92_01945 [Verrucomicrobia subdivision 3 bacterium]|nr:hypothetical protein [Limisphaerales bacterium]
MKLPSSNQITILVLLICSLAFYIFIFRPFNAALHNTASATDAKQGSSLLHFVLSKVNIDVKSVWDTNRPPAYVQAFRNKARLDFFGIKNSDRQEQIFDAVRDWQTTNRNMATLCVRFYESEKPRGKFGQHIETLLREEFIVLSNNQFGVILNEAEKKN